MSALPNLLDQLKAFDLERMLKLRPPYPPVSLQLDPGEVSLVRLKPQRRKPPMLEVVQACPIPEECLPTSIFWNRAPVTEGLVEQLKGLFERTATRPGRVSVVVPDNLAKVMLITLPERPSGRRQLDELVRAQMRRAVPFKLDEARISYQVIPNEGRGVAILIALVRRNFIEPYEQALEQIGSRVGLVDLCTTNLVNLCRSDIEAAGKRGGDAALLNCDRSYFSLAILRGGRLIFFRCKTYAAGAAVNGQRTGVLAREVANSLSYYREKLSGEGVDTFFVRSAVSPADPIEEHLQKLGAREIRRIDPTRQVELTGATNLDAATGERLAPAIGAALGRGR